MILHPGIIALLFGSFIVLLLMLRAGVVALEILWRWDSASSSAVQLRLERRTWLVSTLLNYAFAFQIFSLFLFIFTADDIHRLFIGAMCATGALNANLVGWLVLLLKVGMLFAAGIWLAVNHLDQCTEDTPLVRRKYLWLLLLIPVVLLDLLLQWEYFRGLRPQMITSCCGSLFSSSGEGVMSSLTGLAPLPAAALFFGTVLLYLLLLITTMVRRAIFLRYLLFVAALLLFFAGMLGLVSFLSLYIYQMPGHHCPFDMLQGHYGFIGYPIYAGLFLATLAAMLPGICHPLARGSTSLTRELERCEKLWLRLALFGVLLFLLCACWQMVFGPLVLFGY